MHFFCSQEEKYTLGVTPATELPLQAFTEGWKSQHLPLSAIRVKTREEGLGTAPAGPPAGRETLRPDAKGKMYFPRECLLMCLLVLGFHP